MTLQPSIELLAPVGRWEHLQAAIDERADAIYLGASALNARGDRAQFSEADLSSIVAQAHAHQIKVYLALNILIEDSEFEEALQLAALASKLQVDAAIVQDRGLAEALRRHVPALTLHASTQFSATSPLALPQVKALGFSRVVAPRELTLPELQAYIQYARGLELEVETFIQGAMCISISGQCQMSWAEGDRSANRGICAQPCRLSYRLMEDGQLLDGSVKRLSPADMSRIRSIPALLASGVTSLKIEGRLRSEAYVRTALRSYRTILDACASGEIPELVYDEAEALLHTGFSRGPRFNAGYDEGRGESFLSGPRSGHYGLSIGRVAKVNPNKGELILVGEEPAIPMKRDSVWSIRDDAQREIASAPIRHFTVGEYHGQWSVTLKGFHPSVLRELNHVDALGYLVSYPLDAKASERSSTSGSAGARLDMQLTMKGRYAVLHATVHPFDEQQPAYEVQVDAMAPEDYRSVLGEDRIELQLGKLGGTAYIPGSVVIDGELRAPVSWLNALRRALVEAIDGHDAPEPTKSPDARPVEGEPCPSVEPAEMTWTFPEPGEPVPPRVLHDLTALQGGYDGWTSSSEGEAEDLLIPFDRALIYGLPERTSDRALLLEWPMNLPWLQEERYLKRLPELLPQIDGIVTSSDLAAVLLPLIPESLREGFRLVAGPGTQITNRGSVLSYLASGYTELYLDDGITRGEHDRWILDLQKALPQVRFWVPGGGLSRAMTLRFCPIGYSDPECRRCLSHRYALVNERDSRFAILPFKERGCSAYLLSSEGASAADHRSERLTLDAGFSQWIGASPEA